VVHTIWSSVFVLVVQQKEEDTQPQERGQERQEHWDFEAWNHPSITASSGVLHARWVEQEQAIER
jgi:hypothetical protein